MTAKISLRWDGDVAVAVLPRPCFRPTRYAARCKRPLNHDGDCADAPGPEDIPTNPDIREIRRRYTKNRQRRLNLYGVTKLCDIPGTAAFYRAKRRSTK